MGMRISSRFQVPWTPYSLAFSCGGERLAVGGGSFYGRGGVLLVDRASGRDVCFDCASLPEAPTISGVCFSGDDLYLVASSWTSSHHLGPTLLFQVFEERIELQEKYVQPYTDPIGDPCPTSVLLYGQCVITRSNAAIAEDVISYWEPRQLEGSRLGGWSQHRASGRMIVVRDEVMTGGGGSRNLVEWRADMGKRESGKSVDGLLAVPIGDTESPGRTIPVRSCRRVTAIGLCAIEDEFITGGLNGELDRWAWDQDWKQTRIQGSTKCKRRQLPGSAWATYKPSSVVGISTLSCGKKWMSLSAGGELRLWESDRLISIWEIPELGSPRCISAHPTKQEVAVGIKKLGEPNPEAMVVCIEVGA